MALNSEQWLSYGISAGTATGGFVAKKVNGADGAVDWAAEMALDLATWGAMDYLTATCMALGALGVLVRMYIDISRHMDRKRALRAGIGD